jgi:alpha-L-fucosidase
MIPVPEKRISAYEARAFGMFVHYGAYSRYARGEWVLEFLKLDPAEYEQRALGFDFSSFSAAELVRCAKSAGMRYIVLTARHHDGFSLYDTRGLSEYDVMHTPNGRDLVAEFVEECRTADILPLLYHTTLDWHHPDFKADFPAYLEYLRSSVELLCSRYGKIGGLWFDGNWSKPDADWKLDELYGTIRRLQPDAVIVNNTGLEVRGVAIHPEIDCVTFEQDRPEPMDRDGMSKYLAGEMSLTMNHHWGHACDIDYKSVRELLETICACRKVGANMLLNVGPLPDGRIPTIQRGILEELGAWTARYRVPFYEGRPCEVKGRGKDFALRTADGRTFVFIHDIGPWMGDRREVWNPESGRVFENVFRPVRSVKWVDDGSSAEFRHDRDAGVLSVDSGQFACGENWVVRVAELEFEQ